ncbi:sodium:solute symporter family protein [Pleionea sediminis]|uniref:sodium:solute symporter family protein n=1 Tax=Pleionea sediminis TaxID=2569479 RepID=UPI0011850A17|nr:sodium:solute symporter family protein [Pleionea sediminis]
MNAVVLSTEWAIAIVIVFGVLWVAFGWWLGRNNRTLDDFMLAGRNVGFAFASATAMATWITSNTTLLAPQLTYELGVWGMLGYSMAALGLILFAPLAKRIKALMPHGYTCGDFIRRRYGRVAWYVFLIVALAYSFGWLVSLGMGGGILISTLSGLDYRVGMSAILFICVCYTLLGGLKAVIATDFVQTIIILIGVILIAYVGISKLGLEEIHTAVEAKSPQLLNLLFPAALMFLFNNIFFGIGEIFHSNVWWSRAFAFKDKIGKKAFLLAGVLWLPIPIVTGFIALAAPALGLYPASSDMVGPLIAAKILGGVGAFFVFIVVFSAMASSLDSLLAATSDLITKDIYGGIINKNADKEKLLKVSKVSIVILGVITWALCFPRIDTLAAILMITGAFVASTIWPIVFGLYFRRLNGTVAALAMAGGSAVGLTLYFQVGYYVSALSSCVVSLFVCLIGLMAYDEKFDWKRLQ